MATEAVASSTQIPATEQFEKKMSGEEKASEDPANLATLSESEAESVDDKKIEPLVLEAEKTTDAPVLDVPLGIQTKVENELNPDSQTPDIPRKVADDVESPAELPSLIESVVTEAPKEPAVDISEIGQVEQPNIVDAPLPSIEAIEKSEELLEFTSDKGLVASSVLVDEPKVENESTPDSQTLSIPKKLVDSVESPAQVQSPHEFVIRETPKEPAIDVTEIGQVEEPKIVDAPQSSFEAIEKPEEPLEVTSDKGSVETMLKDIEDKEYFEVQKPDLSIAEDQSEVTQQVEKKHDEVEPREHMQDKTVKNEGSVVADKVDHTTFLEEGKSETDGTPNIAVEEEPEQPKLTEQEKKHDEAGPEKNAEDERVNDEGSSVGKVEETTFPEEGTTDKDDKPSLIGSPEEASLSREAPIELQGEGDTSLPAVTEKITAEDQKKELSGVDVVEKLAGEVTVETEKVREENVESEENKKRNVIPEDSTQPIEEDRKKELSSVDVVEKLVEKAAVEPEKVGEKVVETEEGGKRNLITEDSVQPIIEDQKKELNGADVIENLTEEAVVKLEKVGEENVAKNVETEDNEKSNVITEDSTPTIEEQKKESGGVNVVEKLAEEAAVKLEKVGEEKVAKNDGTEEKEGRSVITEDSTQPIDMDQKKELSAVDVVEKLAEEAAEIEKSGKEKETKNLKFEDNENRNDINEVSTQRLEEVVKSSISPTEVIEKSFEGADKDVETAVESERAEHIKDETPAIVETKKDESVEEKQDEVTRAVNEPLTDTNQSESEVKGEQTVGTDADKLEKAVDDAAKSDQNLEPPPTKDGDQGKPSQDLPEEVPAKPSQKQSNTILSKVKQSLVKAKKAITGKSPSSKTPASGTKDEI